MVYQISNEGVNLSLAENDEAKSVLQNIFLIISTKKGTVPMYRDFGIPMEYIDKPIEIAKTIMASEINEAVGKYEPRAKVKRIIFNNKKDTLSAVVEVEL